MNINNDYAKFIAHRQKENAQPLPKHENKAEKASREAAERELSIIYAGLELELAGALSESEGVS